MIAIHQAIAAYEDGEIVAVKDPRDPSRIKYIEETVVLKRGASLKKQALEGLGVVLGVGMHA